MTTDWLQIIVLLFGNVAWVLPLWLWNRSESRADMRNVDAQLMAMRNLIATVHKETHQEIKSFQDTMIQESKDFHGRLCAIEERKNK